MTDHFERRLHGVAAYNPELLSKQELVAQFVARRELFAELVSDLRRPKFTQHQLIVGHRGMGKTTLLRRLRYAVEDDPELSKRWVALAFPEEQYNVSRLSDLYLNWLDALGDALERTNRESEAAALDAACEKLPTDDDARRAAAALDLLLGTARKLDRRLLLLIDNLDLVLERLEQAQWTIRELLSRENRLLVVAATPFVIGSTYSYDAPFYEFFRIHELQGLSFEETSEVLATLAAETNAPGVERLVREEPARIRTLHVLAGGNPRTIVLLFSVLAQGTEGDVRSDLEKLLDQTTPLYKARFEALAPQAQQVIDALAIHWDPISAGELAEKLRFDVNVVSSQLNRLAQQGVVERVPYDPPTKTGFQIAERFFNIWYLMRASRRVRRRLTWLVQFLRLFYGLDQLQVKAKDLLRSPVEGMPLRQAEFCLAVAEALGEDRPTQLALESRAIHAMLGTEDLRREMHSLFDLDGADAPLRVVIDRQTWAREFRAAIADADDDTAALLRLVAHVGTPAQRAAITREILGMPRSKRPKLKRSLTMRREKLRRIIGSSLLSQFENAVFEGYVGGMVSSEDFSAASAALNAPGLELLPVNRSWPTDKLFEIARASAEPLAWAHYATALVIEDRSNEAEDAIRQVAAGEPSALARSLAARVALELRRPESAISLLQEIRADAPLPSIFWILSDAFIAAGDKQAAFEAIEEGHGRYPDNSSITKRYAVLLNAKKRYQEAQHILEKALGTTPREEELRIALADTLARQGEFGEALRVIEPGLAIKKSRSLEILRIGLLGLSDRNSEAARALSEISLEGSGPRTLAAALHVAPILMLQMSWDSAAVLLRHTLPAAVLQLGHAGLATATVEFFRTAAQHGHAARAADLLEKLDLQEPLRAIYEALRIHAADDRGALNGLAPELRDPVTRLLDAWQENATAAPPARRHRRPKKLKTNRRVR